MGVGFDPAADLRRGRVVVRLCTEVFEAVGRRRFRPVLLLLFLLASCGRGDSLDASIRGVARAYAMEVRTLSGPYGSFDENGRTYVLSSRANADEAAVARALIEKICAQSCSEKGREVLSGGELRNYLSSIRPGSLDAAFAFSLEEELQGKAHAVVVILQPKG